ncbi:hypothetical protein PG994_014059 [Apiospora phragmitis]|uniref:Uncharacterized protein n=1 Tax=Apiospora phragmitis TaxID=2905665 RepID=A0ABR1T394_9PEZI
MHFLLGLLLWGFASYAHADFWVFYEDEGNGQQRYKFFACHDVEVAEPWVIKSDVSGGKRGVRVVGGDKTLPDVFEANLVSIHYTIYKDRGYDIYDLQGNQHGSCQSINDIDYDCVEVNWFGRSVFNCSSDWNATDMN